MRIRNTAKTWWVFPPRSRSSEKQDPNSHPHSTRSLDLDPEKNLEFDNSDWKLINKLSLTTRRQQSWFDITTTKYWTNLEKRFLVYWEKFGSEGKEEMHGMLVAAHYPLQFRSCKKVSSKISRRSKRRSRRLELRFFHKFLRKKQKRKGSKYRYRFIKNSPFFCQTYTNKIPNSNKKDYKQQQKVICFKGTSSPCIDVLASCSKDQVGIRRECCYILQT